MQVNTDSNTRQRDLCHTDAFITSIGQMALSSDYGVQQMTAEDGFQLDSNVSTSRLSSISRTRSTC